jgi:hypothetical protein
MLLLLRQHPLLPCLDLRLLQLRLQAKEELGEGRHFIGRGSEGGEIHPPVLSDHSEEIQHVLLGCLSANCRGKVLGREISVYSHSDPRGKQPRKPENV